MLKQLINRLHGKQEKPEKKSESTRLRPHPEFEAAILLGSEKLISQTTKRLIESGEWDKWFNDEVERVARLRGKDNA